MKMNIYFFIGAIFLWQLTSCKKIINVDLNNAPSQIVIEGMVTNADIAKVTITQSVKFSSNNVFPPISGANVSITDNAGTIFQLSESNAGVYTAAFMGVPGKTYNLLVSIQGKNYTATSTMPLQVNLDTLLTDKIPFGSKSVNIVQPKYTDPKGFGNYYQFVETINHTLNPKIFVWDDRYNDGGVSTRPLIEPDSTIVSGDTIQVEMRCLDKNVYQYFTALSDLQNNSTTPANPVSNISGGCLGYFSAHTSQKKKVVIP